MVKRVFVLTLIFSVLLLVLVGFSALAEARGGGGYSAPGHSGGGGFHGSGRSGGFSGGSHGKFRGGHPGGYYGGSGGSHPGYGHGGSVGSPRGRGYGYTGRGYIGGGRGFGRGFGGPRGPIIRGPAIRGHYPGAIRGGFWGGVVIGGIFSPFWWPFYVMPVPFGYYAPYGYPAYYEPPYVIVVPRQEQAQPQAQEPTPNCYGPRVDQSGNIVRDKDGNMIPDFTKPVPCPPQ